MNRLEQALFSRVLIFIAQYIVLVFRIHIPSPYHDWSSLYVERLPSRPIINKELSNRTVVQGTEAQLQCSVISDQVPYITWLKHTTRYNGVDDEGNIIDRLLIIKVKMLIHEEWH